MKTGKEEHSKLNVIRGSSREFIVRITKDTSDDSHDGEPFDLSNADEIRALFGKADDGVIVKTLADDQICIIDETMGKIKIYLTNTDTSALKVGEEQSFEIEIKCGNVTSIVQFNGVMNVVDRLYTAP